MIIQLRSFRRTGPGAVRRGRVTTACGCLALTLAAASCSLVNLAEDLDAAEVYGLVYGPVETPSGGTEHVYVLLYKLAPEGPSLAAVDRLDDVICSFVFPLDSRHRYRIVAFQDLDGDRRRSADEPAGVLGERHVTVEPAEKRRLEPLRLTRAAELPEALALDLRDTDLKTLQQMPLAAGQVVSLDDERFSRQLASAGMWKPMQAAIDYGAGVFFLEAYDPDRVPVLFVHGVGGTPADFRYLIEQLDRERYQAWVYQYPSGARLHAVSKVLQGLIRGLHSKYGFDSLYVTAHSMGGLVARSAILQAAAEGNADFIKLYVSISTPYNGHEGAAKGVRYLPVSVPCWIDMQPDSQFLVSIREPLPEHLQFYLFFGHDAKGFNPTMNYSSDSVVAVRSQLASFAQEEAVRTWGYDLAHVPILSSPDVAARYNKVLDRVTAELAR